MRSRERIVSSLEAAYRDAFGQAKDRDDRAEMARLDLDFQRDQIHLEVLLDVRDLLSQVPAPDDGGSGSSILDQAEKLRRIARLR